MEYYHVILFLLGIAIAVSVVAPRIRIPYPVLLMLAGMCIGFIPGFQYVPVNPDIIFLIFLPPLLYDAAIKLNFPDFRANLGTISMLAVTMVFITMGAIAVVTHYMIPGISWPVGFVIGAILSPPDAIAATGIIRTMKLPRRTKSILEGESLVNDASALTAYRIGMGVVLGGSFVFWKAGLEFLLIIVGGSVIGYLMAWVFARILKHIKLQTTATISLSIILPFVAYQLAESLFVSGVLSAVVFGLMTAKYIHNGRIFSCETIEQSRPVWNVIIYLMSGLIFILIGLEFPQALRDIPRASLWPLMVSSFVIFVIALVIRILFIFEHKWRTDRFDRVVDEKLHPRGPHRNSPEMREVRSLDWKNALVIGWSGMRGIVSVATAIALPVTLTNGEVFAPRNSIIFLTVMVVVLMLVIQGLGLPLLIKILKINTPTDRSEM